MKILKQNTLTPLAFAIAIIASPVMAHDEHKSYLVDSQGKAVTDGYKECWQAKGKKWSTDDMEKGFSNLSDKTKENCGYVKEEEPVEEMEPVMQMEPAEPIYGDRDHDGVKDNLDRCPNSRTTQVDANGCALDTDRDGVANYLDQCPNTESGMKVDSRGCHIIENITIKLDVEGFDFDSATLRPEMMSALDDIATKILASEGNETISVVGHTDSHGSEAYNQNLSERRASSVVDYLISKGIDSASISATGMGESSPIADNNTSEGRAANRRVEILTK